MPHWERQSESLVSTADFHFLGTVAWEDCLALQRRLVYEAGGRGERRIVTLLCEHPEMITVGRAGSRADIRLSPDDLQERRLDVRWLGRGGGCIVHSPGQLAIYPITPLTVFGWTVGEYLRRLHRGLSNALAELNISAQPRTGRFGVWGRTGQLAAVGAAVQHGVAWQGAFVNVSPTSRVVKYVKTTPERWAAEYGASEHDDSEHDAPEHDAAEHRAVGARPRSPPDKPEMSSLLTERGRPTKMTALRAALVTSLATAWECERYHLFTGHPFLNSILDQQNHRESSVRAS